MEKVLDKVRKLIQLATNEAASEGERENAVRQAHKLLAKHNLAMADVEKFTKQEGRIKENLQTFGMQWCQDAAKCIGELFFCKYFIGEKVNGTKLNHYFVGKESNAVTAALMTEYVIASILKEGRKKFTHNLSPETRNFAIGAVDSLYWRIKEMKKKAPDAESESTGTSLVLADYYETEMESNMAWLATEGTELVSLKRREPKVSNVSAYNAGRKFGDTINLNSQIENDNPVLLK